MSKGALMSHLTNPMEVEKIMKKGVTVYNSEHLHAKVSLFDNNLVVSSANLSNNSQKRLVEAGLFTNEPSAVASARGFFKLIGSQKVNRPFLNLCKRIYKSSKPKNYFEYSSPGEAATGLSHFWIMSTSEVEFSDIEERDFRIQKKIHKKRYPIDVTRFPSSSPFVKKLQPGDQVVEIFTDKKGKTEVYRSKPILWKYSKRIDRFQRTYIVREDREEDQPKSWKKFKSFMRAQGVGGIGTSSNREIIDTEVQQALLGFW